MIFLQFIQGFLNAYLDLNIKYNYSGEFHSFHIDIKQMICHLIAIANNKKNSDVAYLKYVFFKPKFDEKNFDLVDLYNTIEKEWKAILTNGNKIIEFCKAKNIELIQPIYVEINDDFMEKEISFLKEEVIV